MAFEVRLDPTKHSHCWFPRGCPRYARAGPAGGGERVVYALQTGENTEQGRGATAKTRMHPVTNAILYAFDGATGKQLYSSDKLIDSWMHFSEPVVAGGQVYVSTWDGRLYAFGLKK